MGFKLNLFLRTRKKPSQKKKTGKNSVEQKRAGRWGEVRHSRIPIYVEGLSLEVSAVSEMIGEGGVQKVRLC